MAENRNAASTGAHPEQITPCYSPDLLQSKGLCQNGNDILMKPFRLFDLARKVREALDKQEDCPAGQPKKK